MFPLGVPPQQWVRLTIKFREDTFLSGAFLFYCDGGNFSIWLIKGQ
jgi:hypothetical protein